MSANPKTSRSTHQTERTENNELTTAELLDLFGDEYTRRVYEVVAEQPQSGRAVAEAADVSRPTAYRRLNDLRDAGLLHTEMAICEDGHHRERFEAVATTLSVSLDEDGMDAMVSVGD
jgi:DNA-binding transcriptional ArsR family regulator